MPRPAKDAFVAAAFSALVCGGAYILFAIYLDSHRPRFPEGLNCWPVKVIDLVFVTRAESLISDILKYAGFVATFIAVVLDISSRRRR
jgi:hypothetical protein